MEYHVVMTTLKTMPIRLLIQLKTMVLLQLSKLLNITREQAKFVLEVQKWKFTTLEPLLVVKSLIQVVDVANHSSLLLELDKSLKVGMRELPNLKKVKRQNWFAHLITPTVAMALVVLSRQMLLCILKLNLWTGKNDDILNY